MQDLIFGVCRNHKGEKFFKKRPVACRELVKMMFLGKPLESGSARLGHIPSLPWESQLPLKPCISLQPLAFQGNCDSSDCFLDFCFISWCKFDLLRKCGLLAHTSPAFLKNCWIKKLLFACGSVIAANMEKQLIFTNCFMRNIALGRAACPPILEDALPFCPFGTFPHTVGNHPPPPS